jgi:L-fuconolactonase
MPRIIDSHLHFWDRERFRYPWLDDETEPLGLSHRPSDLVATGWAADSIVAVQADCLRQHGLGEASWFSELAVAGAPIDAIVAFAPLDVPGQLAPHLVALAELPLVTGVRRLLQDANPGLATSPEFVEGVRSLANYDFTMDLCIRQPQLAEATLLVEQCPEVRFVLDHLGKPSIRPGDFAAWADDLSRLAALPNVVVKLSGLMTEAAPDRRTSAALRPWLAHALEVFGPTRSMFGSDWPVLNTAASFAAWVDVIADALSDLTAEEADAVWSRTAAATYLRRD